MAEIKFDEDVLHMDVLCVKRFLDYTLAGIGSNLFIFSNESLLLSEPIFVGERIHSINTKNEFILVKGGRLLSLLKLKESFGTLKCEIISKIQSSDWIQVVLLFENQLAGLVTAHNFFECWDLEKKEQLKSCSCKEKCILYSCNLVGETLEDSVIFAGTVFGEVLIWSPLFKENPTLQRLQGHNGAVFSVEVKLSKKLLATTSDDRSLKIWSIDSQQPLCHPNAWKNATISLIHTLFGHTARVWRSLILPECYVTIGEDSKLIVWSKDGEVMKSVCLHQESGIRGLDYLEAGGVITTGGEDGGVNAFSLKYLFARNDGLRMLNLGQSVSTKVCFTQSGVVFTLNGRCIIVSDVGEEEIYKNDHFASYCLLEVSGDYIIMGSIKGDLVVINTNTKTVLFEERIIDGRIYSVHCLREFWLTCGPEGRLDLWRFSDGILKNSATMTLPNCKDRWTTCAAAQKDKLIVGDRMGNLHVYKPLEGGNPVRSFRKIHSYLGVTDVMFIEGGCLSVGRDGTVKEFTEDLTHSLTCKLPMEWPWKMVKCEDDILILGFHSVSFIVWSMKDREIIANHECGGGHRSCDYKLNGKKLSFLYVKDKKVSVVDLSMDGITRIRNGFHGKEINCLKIIQNTPTIIATGSEDTTLRISRIENSQLKSMEVMKTHVSSIRTVSTCATDTGQLIVSAGGKGQIVVWEFNSVTLKCREVVSHRLRKENQSWKSLTPAVDPETRIMCADVVRTGSEFLIAAGCSDCRVRIFSFSWGLLDLLREICLSHCVLNVTFLKVGVARMLVSMGTDGRVAFWDATDCRNICQMGVFPIHQSGINSFHFEEIENGKFILATGGDDNKISIAWVGISGREVQLSHVWEARTAHSCQITGIKILKNFLVTTSIDQRITVWRWSWLGNEFTAEYLNQYLTAVPDIQGMDATWLSESTILLAVHGKGMQTLRIDVGQ